jgi:hypothetical protein
MVFRRSNIGEQKDKNILLPQNSIVKIQTFEGLWVDNQRAWVGKWSNDLGQKDTSLFEVQKSNTDNPKGFWTMKIHLTMKEEWKTSYFYSWNE